MDHIVDLPSFPNKKLGQQIKRVTMEEQLSNLQKVDDNNEEIVRRIIFTPMDF